MPPTILRQSLLSRLARARGGSATVEFALGALPLVLTIMAVMEFSAVLFTQTVLEGAVRDASRFGVTGGDPTGSGRAARILEIVSDRSLGLVSLGPSAVTMKVYQSYADIGQPEPFVDQAPLNGRYDPGEMFGDRNGNGVWDDDMGTPGVGGPGEIAVYTIRADWPLLTGLLAPFFGRDRLQLTASMVVRNEPYDVP